MTSHEPEDIRMTPEPANLRARDLFDRASAGLDQGMAYRLRRARQDAQQPRAATRPGRGLVPVGAFAAAALALGIVWWMPPPATVANGNDAMAASELDELVIDEDAELYAWLADAPVATASLGPRL